MKILITFIMVALILSGCNVSTPTITPPTVSTPTISTPTVSTPHISTPTVSTPTVSTPHISTPTISTPTVSTPTVSAPTVTAPKVTISTTSTASTPTEDNPIWVIVYKTNPPLLEEADQKVILEEVKTKWFQTQPYQVINFSEYKSANFVGRTVVHIQAFRQSGEYDFSARTIKIWPDGSEETVPGPAGFIDHRKDVDDLLREIRDLK